jgi:hypothetical protein
VGLAVGTLGTAGFARPVATGLTTTTLPGLSTPAGQQRVSYGQASIAVPANWQVFVPLAPGAETCHDTQVVLLGYPSIQSPCSSAGSGQSPDDAQLLSLPRDHPSGPVQMINGFQAIDECANGSNGSCSTGARIFYFPQLDVMLYTVGRDASSIAHSITWSSRQLVVNAQSAGMQIPSGWQVVTSQGITLQVPPSWPVHHTLFCDPYFQNPAVYEGQVTGASCGGHTAVYNSVDGVWLVAAQPGTSTPPSPNEVVLRATPQRLLLAPAEFATDPILALIAVTREGMSLELYVGIGPNPAIAAEIIASISTGG